MSNGRTEVYLIEQQVKGRRILAMQALVAIVLGTIVLGHEIAVAVLQVHNLGRPLTTAQIIASVAALFTILAGLASYFPSRLNADPRTLRRNFIISSVLALIATILLAVTLGFFVPRVWDLWTRATSVPGSAALDYSDPTQTGNAHMDYSVHLTQYANGPMAPYDIQYTLKVIAILKIVALLADSILIGATLVITILSIINVMRRRASYQPAPIHDPNHGTRVYYDKNSR